MDDSLDTQSEGTLLFTALLGILLHIVFLLVAIFFIVVVNSTQLHRNCKFLLTIWGIGYVVQFGAHFVMLATSVYSGTLPLTKKDSQLRSYVIDVSTSSQCFSEIVEILIASERIVSAARPANYHKMGMSSANYHLVTAGSILLLEACTLTINFVAARYCGSRYRALQGKATLNARYQVKEAYYVAAAMQRAYLVTFLFKNFSNGIIVATCYRTDESQNCVPLLFTLQYAVIELIYVLGVSTASTILLLSLFRNHPQLRKAIAMRFKMKLSVETRSEQTHSHQLQGKPAGDIHFIELRKSWG